MKKHSILALSLVACLVGVPTGNVAAFESIGDDWVAYYTTVCQTLVDATLRPNDCILCHSSGFGLNPYGGAVDGSGGDWASIEGTDSDNDGRTNGEEILIDCTFPGDQLSVPEEDPTWSAVKALFR